MKPHILVLHRAPEIAMPFADRIDHDANAVTYVATSAALGTIPGSAAAVVVLDDYADAPAVVHELSAQYGPPDRIIARSEYDLLTAAALRRELGVQGDLPDEVLLFRDKLVMGAAITTAGLPAPAAAEIHSAADVSAFADTHGFPVVVKPRLGASSRDVEIIKSARELSRLPNLNAEPYMAQRFCADRVGHIDGVWTGSRLGPWRASLYVESCLSFATGGKTLGSVEIDDPMLVSALGEFTHAVCRTLSSGRPQVFHLEYFLGREADGTPKVNFLEIAARVGGTEIAYIWRDLHNYDLLGASLDIQMGRRPQDHRIPDNVFGGFLVIRPNEKPPCRVVSANTDFDNDIRSAVFAQAVPQPGSLIRQTEGYLGVGAAFRFSGHSSAVVARSIQRVCSEFTMTCVEVPA